MKQIFKFTLNKTIEVDETIKSTNEKGEEVSITKKVKKPEIHNYIIRKPNRTLTEEGELFYNKVYWQCVKENNIQPAIQMQKRFLNDGGVLSDDQKKEYNQLYVSFFDKRAEYQALSNKTDKTEEEKKKENDLLNETVQILEDIQKIEGAANSQLYQNTAESIARNRTSFWWMINLSYEDLGGDKFKPVFGDGDYTSKLKVYDNIDEEEDEFQLQLVKKLLLATSLWYFQKADTQEDFEILAKMYDNNDLSEAVNSVNTEILPEEVKSNIKDNIT